MCLILFSWDNHPVYKLILAANRDEFYIRPTLPLHEWDQNSDIIAGKDMTGGGTWMGISKNNRFAALTNYRDPTRVIDNPPSRGDLTLDFLNENPQPRDYFISKKNALQQYNGFNLLTGSLNTMSYFNNIERQYKQITAGTYGLSNAVLDTPWPKVKKAKAAFSEILAARDPKSEDLFGILKDKTLANDSELPQTGVPYEWEKAISAIFIEKNGYGTCCSTIITVTHEGQGEIRELSYPVGDRTPSEKIISFDWSEFK
ncbi:MAG: NRDE family protein [Cyclobacteriaceae bacterium]